MEPLPRYNRSEGILSCGKFGEPIKFWCYSTCGIHLVKLVIDASLCLSLFKQIDKLGLQLICEVCLDFLCIFLHLLAASELCCYTQFCPWLLGPLFYQPVMMTLEWSFLSSARAWASSLVIFLLGLCACLRAPLISALSSSALCGSRFKHACTTAVTYSP